MSYGSKQHCYVNLRYFTLLLIVLTVLKSRGVVTQVYTRDKQGLGAANRLQVCYFVNIFKGIDSLTT